MSQQPDETTKTTPASKRKRSILLTIVMGLAGVIALFLVYAASKPDQFKIERSHLVKAPSPVVYSIVNDLHQWDRWSPYSKLDPEMKKTYEGPDAGPGASYAWNGNGQVGEGKLTIAESKPDEFVKMDLQFTRPFECQNKVTFAFVPQGDETKVSWIMEGKNTFVSKIMDALMDMDKMCGTDFEKGLATLDTIAQEDAKNVKTNPAE